MDTTTKGNHFEDRVFEAISKELNAERLGLLPNSCEIFRKKGYYSRDRNAEIIVDISIEITQPQADTYSFLWVCECKDYSGSIPVDDVEEFNDKLRQIAGKNVKGVIAIGNGCLQSGALSVAKANGIGVIRILPDNQTHWVIQFIRHGIVDGGLNQDDFLNAIVHQHFEGINRNFYAIDSNYIIGDWHTFLRKTLGKSKLK